MFGTVIRIIAAVAFVGLLGAAGVGIYQAGFVAGAAAGGTTVVPPFVGYGWYSPGWFGPGFGLFGFLGTLLVVFLLFGLLKAVFGRGPRGGWNGGGAHDRHGWGPGPDAFPGGPWEDRAREIHEALHRRHGPGAPDPDEGQAPTGRSSAA